MAVREFEASLTIQDHPTVLLNLGEAYAALGRPVEASDRLLRYLEHESRGDAAKDLEERAQAILQVQRRRIAWITVVADRAAEVCVDGRCVAASGDSTVVAVASGWHAVVARYAEGEAQAGVEVQGGERRVVELPRVPSREKGVLQVDCALPDVEVTIDGIRQEKGVPIFLPPGRHEVRSFREGYLRRSDSVSVSSGVVHNVDCQLNLDPLGTPSSRGVLKVSGVPRGASVELDGQPYRGEGLTLGRHLIEVGAEGYIGWKRLVIVNPGPAQELQVRLKPTARQLRDMESRRSDTATWSIVAGAGAVVLGGAAIGLALASDAAYADGKRQRAELERVEDEGGNPDQGAMLRRDLWETGSNVARLDALALGAGVMAGTCLTVGIFLAVKAMSIETGDSPLTLELGEFGATRVHF